MFSVLELFKDKDFAHEVHSLPGELYERPVMFYLKVVLDVPSLTIQIKKSKPSAALGSRPPLLVIFTHGQQAGDLTS